MNRIWAFVPLVALLALIVAGAFLLLRGGEREAFTTGLVGQQAPAFALARLDGGAPLTNADMAGRTYVINLFASWCTPCRAEHPLLMELEAQGVEIVGVAYKDRPEASAQFLTSLGDPYRTVVMDRDGRFGLDVGLIGVPETYVIGPDGVIRAAYRGPLTPEIVEREIMPALRR